MENKFEFERVNEDEYLVRWASEGQTGESVVQLNQDFLSEAGLGDFEQQAVVEKTAELLAERQPVIDFPLTVDLEEISAAYGDFAEQLRSRLAAK